MQGLSEWSNLDGVPEWVLGAGVFLFGLAVGSFLNVVIHRLPRGVSVVAPGSQCPRCGTRIKPQHNVPLVSFVLLRGKCASCGASISPVYPIVEAATAILFLLIFLKTGFGWTLLLNFAFAAAIGALAVIDAKHRILPDAITYPGLVLAVGLRALIPDPNWKPLMVVRYEALVSELTPTWQAIAGAVGIALSCALLLLIEWLDYRILGKRIEQAEAALAAAPDHLAEQPRAESETREAAGHLRAAAGESNGAPAATTETEVDFSHLEKRGFLEWAVIALALGLAGLFLIVALIEEPIAALGFESVLHSLAGAIVGGWFLWLSRLVYYAFRKLEGVGFGDIKMMLMIGAFLGWQGAFMTILIGSVLGSVYGVTVMLLTRERNPKMAFGLYLGISALITFFIQV